MHILATLTPLDPVSGERVTLRGASAQLAEITALGGQRWWPAIMKKPKLSLRLFDGDFTSSVDPGNAAMAVSMSALARLDPNVDRYLWAEAGVELFAGEADTPWPWPSVFAGKVGDFSRAGSLLSIAAEVDEEPFKAMVPAATYAGTSGLEGGEDVKGRVKPWALGFARFVEPVLLDVVYNVYQVSAYGPISGISALYERGASKGAALGDYPNLAALVAANVPEGRWATCNAHGLIRLGAPPYGTITADVAGDYAGGVLARQPGAIISRVCAAAGVDPARIDTASLAAMDAAMTALPAGGNINLYLTDQQGALDLIREIARSCNYQAGIGFDGRLFVTRPSTASPTLRLDAQGRERPPVVECSEASVSPPYKRLQMSGARCWRPLALGEIAFIADLIDKGDYDGATVYREGNIVTMPDGSRWVFVGATPAANSPPSDANADWARMTGASSNVRIFFLDHFPADPRIGDIAYRTDQGNKQYRYVGIDAPISIGGVVIDIGGSTIAAGQWVLVTDDRLIETIIDTNQAGAVAQEAAARLTRNEQRAIEHRAVTDDSRQKIDDLQAMLGAGGTIDIPALMARLEAVEAGVYTTQETLGGLVGSISEMNTVIEGQAGTLAQHTTDINAGNAAVESVSEALDLLGTEYAGTRDIVSTMGLTVESHQEALTVVEGGLTTLFAQQYMTIDAEGRVSGLWHAATDTYSSIRLRADMFTIEAPVPTGDRFEYSSGVMRIYGGSTMLAFGAGFGSAGQFLRWSGPAQASLTGCTEANAIEYGKTSGEAYFGGALLAGALRAGSTSPSLSTTASASTGLIGSNGAQVNVIGSFTYTSTQSASYAADSTGLANYDAALFGFGATIYGDGIADAHTASKADNKDASQLTLNIRRDGALMDSQGGANGTVSLVGWKPIPGDSPGTITWTYTYSKSVTIPDPALGTGNRTYTADILRGFTPPGTGSQRVSIQSVEY